MDFQSHVLNVSPVWIWIKHTFRLSHRLAQILLPVPEVQDAEIRGDFIIHGPSPPPPPRHPTHRKPWLTHLLEEKKKKQEASHKLEG